MYPGHANKFQEWLRKECKVLEHYSFNGTWNLLPKAKMIKSIVLLVKDV